MLSFNFKQITVEQFISVQRGNVHQAKTQKESLLHEETATRIVLSSLEHRLPGKFMSSGCSHGSLSHKGNLPQTARYKTTGHHEFCSATCPHEH